MFLNMNNASPSADPPSYEVLAITCIFFLYQIIKCDFFRSSDVIFVEMKLASRRIVLARAKADLADLLQGPREMHVQATLQALPWQRKRGRRRCGFYVRNMLRTDDRRDDLPSFLQSDEQHVAHRILRHRVLSVKCHPYLR